MEAFHTIAATTALILLLLAVLRHRQHPIPVPLRAGVFVAPVGELFAIAQLTVGPETINSLLVANDSPDQTSSFAIVNDTEVSETYFVVMQLFNLISVTAILLIAVGMLMLVRRIIRDYQPIPQQP